ncbi:MAG: hypothetical protein AAGC60_29650 [Acidobacteriota bacterium]
MRIGERSVLAFDLEPLEPSWPRRAANERGPWARFRFWVDGINTCRSSRPDSLAIEESVAVPLAPIADWFVTRAKAIAFEESARAFPTDTRLVDSLIAWKQKKPAAGFDSDRWDDARYDWWERHFLQSNGDGAWIPNLAFARADGDLWINAGPSRFATPEAPRFFIEDLVARVDWDIARRTLDDFVAWVAGELRERGLQTDYSWSREAQPFDTALEYDLLTYADIGLGLDRDAVRNLFGTADEEVLRRTLGLVDLQTAESSIAFLALRDLEAEPGVGAALIELENDVSVADEIAEPPSRYAGAVLQQIEPEIQGKDAARKLRQDLGLGAAPIQDLDAVVAALKIALERSAVRTLRDHSICGRRGRHAKIVLFESPSIRQPWASRMEIARAVGHLLTDGHERQVVGAGSSTRASGPRRRRSGAFAAELLLPEAAIEERTDGILDRAAEPSVFEHLMSDFGVGARTAAWNCWNAGYLSSTELVDDLVGRYASLPEAAA